MKESTTRPVPGVFSKYGGKKKRCVTICFLFALLDTAAERFGTKDARYSLVDDKNFTVNAEVEIIEQFFDWLLGYSKRAKLSCNNNTVFAPSGARSR